VSTLININLNNYIFPGNFAAHLAQSSPGGSRPKRIELFWAEPDLAFFPVCAAAHLESQRCGRAFSAETDLSACGLTRQITLIDNVAPRAFQFIGQPLKQKFAFNFSIVCCSSNFLHKANMLNAMSLLSRFSRWQRDVGGRVVLNPLGKRLRRRSWQRRCVNGNQLAPSAISIVFRRSRSTLTIKSPRAGRIRAVRRRLPGLARLRSPRLLQRTVPLL